MNSNFNKFDFDLGIGSNNRSSKSLNDQKNKSNNNNNNNNSYSSYSYSSQPKTTPSWQPGKPSWTHQPAPSQPGVTRTELGGPASMVGDITGRSWNSTAPPPKVAVASSIGIVNKNPNLFGDLVSSAIGQNNKVGSNNVPLKSATPVRNSSAFSMGGVADTLPKTSSGSGYGIGSNSGPKSGGGGVASWATSNQSSVSGGTSNASVNKGFGSGSGSGLGGPSLRSGGGVGGGMSSNKDPFGSLMGFSSKPMGSSVGAGGTGIGSAGKSAANVQSDDFGFGDFQKAGKSNPSSGGTVPNMNSFGTQKQTAAPVHTTSDDAFDMFVSSKPASGMGNAATDSGAGGQQFSGGDDWLDSGFGGHDDGNKTELDGLPLPPAGVSASTAKTKGLDNYKQGQYADAIKWLSWAEILLERAGEVAGTMEVLSCRASCYKEVGEYKKAVADCTKVLDNDGKNVAALVQRALLYESMEKYRLGAEDLRTVMKLDPMNRVARSTIHRLQKMAD